MRISDWSSGVCSSDLYARHPAEAGRGWPWAVCYRLLLATVGRARSALGKMRKRSLTAPFCAAAGLAPVVQLLLGDFVHWLDLFLEGFHRRPDAEIGRGSCGDGVLRYV